MAITDIIPWTRPNRTLATRRQEMDPFNTLRREIDRVFGDFLTDSRWPERMNLFDRQMGSFMPEIDVKETDKEIRVTAELPGMEQKDIEVTFVDGGLTIKGEKREEQEEEKGDWYHSERRWGAFERMIPLPADIDLNKAKAWFKKGVLKVTLPKSEQARSNRKTIPVEG